jgi:hypothetical protein
MYCLKLKHVWERFALAGNHYRKCRRCFITQIDVQSTSAEETKSILIERT